jgi:hypothetical protein
LSIRVKTPVFLSVFFPVNHGQILQSVIESVSVLVVDVEIGVSFLDETEFHE